MRFVLVVLVLFRACFSVQSIPGIGFQVHSINDLNEWNQLLLKGSVHFKIDPHYTTSDDCSLSGIESREGCLLLSHDYPETDKAEYDSSDDLVKYLYSDEFSRHRNGRNISIALCFKSAPEKCQENSTLFNDWLYLVDNLHSQLTQKGGPEGVEIVLDGDGKPIDCLVGRWKPWNSVWIEGKSPREALYSNALENDYYRFQILNDPEGYLDWKAMSVINYGKFSESQYAYQLWEVFILKFVSLLLSCYSQPDGQRDILNYISIYEKGQPHIPGFDFAINIDVGMFGVYSSSPQGSLSCKVPESDGFMRPLLQFLRPPPSRFSFLQVVERECTDEKVVMYGYLSNPQRMGSGGEIPPLSTLPGGDTLVKSGAGVVALSLLHQNLVVVSSNGMMNSYSILAEREDAPLMLKTQGSLLGLDGVLDGVLVHDDRCLGQCLVSLSFTEDSGLLLSLSDLLNDTVRSGYPLLTSVGLSLPSIEGVAAGRVRIHSEGVLVFCSAGDTMYLASLPKEVLLAELKNAFPIQWVVVGTGRHIDVTISGQDQSDVLMVVSDFGYCYNSHKHNTRSSPTVCSSPASPTASVLDYSLGLIKDWLHVANGKSQKITSCHQRIMHGSYDQGSRPAVALSSSAGTNAIENNHLYFLVAHEALPANSSTRNNCGNPMHRDGIVLDSFPVNDWIQRLRAFDE